MTRGGGWAALALRWATAGALALGSAELVMRQVAYAPRHWDADYGFVVEDGATTRWAIEGNGTGHYVGRGVRQPFDRANANRILVVGDSFVEALHVDDDQTFAEVARRTLAADGATYTFVNVGVAGFRTPKYVELAPKYRAEYAPTWTVVVLNEDDLQDDMFVRNDTYFEREGDAGLGLHVVSGVADVTGPRRAWRVLKSRSALLQNAGLQAVGFLADARQTRLFRGGAARPPEAADRDGDWRVSAALELLVAAYDRRVTVVLLTALAPAAGDRHGPVAAQVESFCAATSVSCVSTAAAWTDLERHRKTPFGFANRAYGAGHLNLEGHRTVGALVAAELARLGRDGLL